MYFCYGEGSVQKQFANTHRDNPQIDFFAVDNGKAIAIIKH